MSYLIHTASGDGHSDSDFGVDIKQELAEGLTGLISVRPDFSTIARSLESIGFTYTQQYLDDTRPFFQEGSRYFWSPWFYTNSVGEIDLAAKLYGQWKGRDVGFLDAILIGKRNDLVFSLRQPSSDSWGGGLFFVRRSEGGDDNNVLSFNLGRPLGDDLGWVSGSIAKSMTTGPGGDGMSWNMSGSFNTKFWRGWLQYEDFSPDFVARNGYIQWPSSRGWHGSLGYDQTFAPPERKGRRALLGGLRQSNVRWMFNRIWHHEGRLWHEDYGLRWRVRFLQPYELNLGYTIGCHDNEAGGFHHDRLATISLGIGNDPRQNTWMQYQFGRQGSRDYIFTNLSQSFALTRKLSAGVTRSFARLQADDGTVERRRRDILWAAYDLSDERSLSFNVIRRDGISNFYMSYRQAARRGTDIFLLYGDPNSETTVHQLICKFIYAL